MGTDTYESTSPEATRQLGARLACRLGPGDVVTFRGDLGAGKTCMIQGLCAALEVEDYVTSPTFILINEYRGKLGGRPIDVYHLDLYRVRSAAALEDLGVEEYLYGQGICLVEWPEQAGASLPARRLEVDLVHRGATHRTITVRALAAQEGSAPVAQAPPTPSGPA
jgi:tRNA threonylcarbamoyladenosine biosynthesis protein TsaE